MTQTPVKQKAASASRHVALVAVMSATLVGGKFALSFIPNVEIVTTLLLVYAFVFGPDAVLAALVFCTCDILLYPPALDVIVAYYIYWPMLAIAGWSLKLAGVTADAPYLIVALVFTAAFGFLTTATSHFILGLPYWPTYVAGLLFYAIHLISTLIVMLVAFKPLTRALHKLNRKFIAKS